MRKAASTFLLAYFTCMTSFHVQADISDVSASMEHTQVPFTPFTGKISRDKVRLRSQAALDGPIVKELGKGDLLIILGETEDFYAIEPPKGTKAYIFRTFVLDNTVEGSHVNVRIEPNIDAPIIAQLNQGETIQGAISSQNNKWLEIIPPSSTRFYVSKDYVEKIGDRSVFSSIERRRQEADQLLGEAIAMSQMEMQKTFDQIRIDPSILNLNKVIRDYTDFPDKASRAKSYLTTLQEAYMQKKIAHLEEKNQHSDTWQSKSDTLQAELQAQQQRYSQLQQKLATQSQAPAAITSVNIASESSMPSAVQAPQITERMTAWVPFETVLYDHWKIEQPDLTWDEFYHMQHQNAVTLRGVIEPYNRSVKNKPGDFVLVSKATNLPIAYLYSTKVNLLEKVGQEVVIEAYSRPNNNFAFPAYYVITTN